MKKSFLLLLLILVTAIGFRFYKLGEVPVSPDWDETALGYNAYSILKTGRDEYGTRLPLTIRSFDDYKPPLYVYLTVPSIALFDLSLWSTRLPSAVAGVLAVLGTYFLVKELLKDNDTVALLASFLLAISPWHIQLSRVAFETNVGASVTIWAITAFLIGLRKRIFLPVSAALFGIGLYSYHSERVFLPLIAVFLVITQWKRIFTKENKIAIITALIIGLIFIVPVISIVFGENGLLRMKATSTFTDTTNLLARNIPKLERDQRAGDVIGAILDNRRIVYAKTVISGYLSHYSLQWLFLTSDNPRHHAPDMGLLYIWELPFLLFGIYWVSRYTKGPLRTVLFGWFLLAPIPAAPTTGLPHAVRTLNFLPTYQIFTAIGLLQCFVLWKKIYSSAVMVSLYGFFILFNIIYFCDMYFIHQNPENSEYWQYGYKEAVALTEKIKSKYKKVVVSTKLDQSYMFFLFYTKYDPAKYLAHGGTKSGSFEEVRNRFDMYEFRLIDWPKEKRDGTILYVGAPQDMPHGNVANITFLNGKPAIEMADQPNGAP
jgi:4-amino-4-deoxy-L-arabinose transferase-like glycosyltransferase